MLSRLLSGLTCHKACYGVLAGLAGAACVGVDPMVLKYVAVVPYTVLAVRDH
ncbi:MAG: hypothetical protein AAF557_24735 [Pseudomonadota bacterium]